MQWDWLDESLALAIHEKCLAEHGGATGIRDQALLQSALARAQNLAAYSDAVDAEALAAAYTAGVVKNHPFIDGNKRTGFILGILFLELHGRAFTASEEAATKAALSLAAGEMDETGYAEFLRKNTRKAK
jgi:death-on-curing protein